MKVSLDTALKTYCLFPSYIIWKVLCQKTTVKVRHSRHISAGKRGSCRKQRGTVKKLKKRKYSTSVSPSFERLTLGNSNFVVGIITIIDSGNSSVYTSSCWTSDSLWSLSFPVPFPEADSSRAPTFRTFNGKLSWKSRWFLYNESEKINKQRFIINNLWKCN